MTTQPQTVDRWLHELRNQLSVSLGFSEMLLQEFEDGDAKKADLNEIYKAAGRAMDALARPPMAEDRSR